MPASDLFVLAVGVDHYPDYSGQGLRGAVRDATWWSKLAVRALGAPAANVRLLASADAHHRGAGPADDATAQDILDGVEWLARSLAECAERGGTPQGLIVYCGHGTATAQTGESPLGLSVALCGSDLAIDDGIATGIVETETIQEILALAALKGGATSPGSSWVRDVTVVLDCCYSEVQGLQLQATDKGSSRLGKALANVNLCRFVLACNPYDLSYEIQSDGRWHGAFSFSMLTLLEQWTVKRADDNAWFNVNLQTLLSRATELLGLLGLQQAPLMVATPRVALIPMLRPGMQVHAGMSSPFPDKERPSAQIDAGAEGFRVFSLSVSDGTSSVVAAYVLLIADGEAAVKVTAADSDYWVDVGREYWYLLPSAKAVVDAASDLSFTLALPSQALTQANVNSFVTSNGLESLQPIAMTDPAPFHAYADFGPPQQPSNGVVLPAMAPASPPANNVSAVQLAFSAATGSPGSQTRRLHSITWHTPQTSVQDDMLAGLDSQGATLTLAPPPQGDPTQGLSWWRGSFATGNNAPGLPISSVSSSGTGGPDSKREVRPGLSLDNGDAGEGPVSWATAVNGTIWHTVDKKQDTATIDLPSSPAGQVVQVYMLVRPAFGQPKPQTAFWVGTATLGVDSSITVAVPSIS